MNEYLKNIYRLLRKCSEKEANIVYATLLTYEKKGQITDLINSPTLQNVINLLAPYITNYNIRQVISLLKDLNEQLRQKGIKIGY